MLKQLDFTLNGLPYMIFYDSEHMTEEQAKLECQFVGWGKGHDESLYPYYLIVTKAKTPILNCIKQYVIDKCRKE